MPFKPNDPIESAFTLACFIHRERVTAINITTQSLDQLKVESRKQGKRLGYRLRGLTWRLRKTSLPEPALLQRLVYIESTKHEVRQEQDAGWMISEGDMILRFTKYLIEIS